MRVGIFDSGLGGLSVWREIAARCPALETWYLADQAHVPYGPRQAVEIRGFARAIARAFEEQRCDAVVVACNTASAAALAALRAEFPALPFVGMEPAVKPAAAVSTRRVVAVLATPATFQGELFATAVERFAAGVHIVRQVCPGLVERIEAGDVDATATKDLLQELLAPALAAGADTIVLACTHYPFVRPAIEAIAGPGVQVIDPAPAVARQVGRVVGLEAGGDAAPAARPARFFTTGDRSTFERVARRLLGFEVRCEAARWNGDRLHLEP